MNASYRMMTCGIALVALSACGGGSGGAVDARASLLASCSSQQGIGWLKKEHGDQYCECWADAAEQSLSPDNYKILVKATQAEMEAADEADREKIVRQHTEIYSTVANEASGVCRQR